MARLRGVVLGTLAGAAAGAVVGWVLAGGVVTASFRGWATVWRDCGRHVFIPLWIAVVAGFASRLIRAPLSGLVFTVMAGMAAGIATPAAYQMAFGTPFVPPKGFASLPNVLPLLLAFCGGVTAAFWRLAVDRFID